jgi:hypothetical protein
LLWLVAGLFLGTILVAAAVLLTVLATGGSVLGPSPREKAALAENKQLKDAAEAAKGSNQVSLKAKDEKIAKLDGDINDLRAKLSQKRPEPPPQDDGWSGSLRGGTFGKTANGAERQTRAEKELKIAQKRLEEKANQIAKLQEENKGLIEKLAKAATGTNPNSSQSKDPDKKKDPIKPSPPNDADRENAASKKLETAKIRYKNGDKEKAISLLKDLTKDYAGTKAADEGEKLLASWMKE